MELEKTVGRPSKLKEIADEQNVSVEALLRSSLGRWKSVKQMAIELKVSRRTIRRGMKQEGIEEKTVFI